MTSPVRVTRDRLPKIGFLLLAARHLGDVIPNEVAFFHLVRCEYRRCPYTCGCLWEDVDLVARVVCERRLALAVYLFQVAF